MTAVPSSLSPILSMLVCLALPAGLLTGPLHAAEAGSPHAPTIDLPFVSPGPVDDGDPSDAAWAGAAVIDTFHPLGAPERTSGLTTVRALYDDVGLHLLYECRGKPGREVRATGIARDGTFRETDDVVEFFFFPGGQDTTYIQFAANAIGAKFDTSAPRMNLARDYAWTAAPGWTDDGWVLEMTVPLRPFAEGVSAGAEWRVDFARVFRSAADSARSLTWAPAAVSFHEPDRFGRIRFARETTFRDSPLAVDWPADEKAALANLERLRGGPDYAATRAYLDRILSANSMHRPFEFLRGQLLPFLRAWPDSAASLQLGLKAVYPMTVGLRLPPETVEAFSAEVTGILHPAGIARDLFTLARGLYFNDTGRPAEWISAFDALSDAPPSVRATAAFFLLSRTRPGRALSGAERGRLTRAIDTWADLVIRGSVPLHLAPGAGWLAVDPRPDDGAGRTYLALRNALRILPEPVMAQIRSLRGVDLPGAMRLVLTKAEFELYARRGGPFFSPARADSMILAIAPLDSAYVEPQLNMLLRDRIRDCEAAYKAMGTDSLPAVIRAAARLRRHYDRRHPIDMVLTMAYETIDSLDAAVVRLEGYLGPVEGRRGGPGPAVRYLRELRWRLAHREEPGYREIRRDAFRFVYRTQAFRGVPNILDIGSDGRAVLYADVPDTLDPRAVVTPTVPARADSPAVAFRLSRAEVDSIYALITRNDFLSFKLRYEEPCNQCPATEMTLITPFFARTVHLEGESADRAPFRVAAAVSDLLARYLSPLPHLRNDWKALVRNARRWGEENDPDTPPDRRLDLLLEAFEEEPFASAWKAPGLYIEPMRALGRETGRSVEIEAAIGRKHFDDAFRWTRYAREHLPAPDDPDLAAAAASLRRAADRGARKNEVAWDRFLAHFIEAYQTDPGALERQADALPERADRARGRSMLLWLACAEGDAPRARALHDRLIDSRAGKRSKFQATLRLMLFDMDAGRIDEALAALARIEGKYRSLLAPTRKGPILELDDYTRADLHLDRADLFMRAGRLEDAIGAVKGVRAEDVPPSRMQVYRDIRLIADHPVPPARFDRREIRDDLGAYAALIRYGRYDEAGRWGQWLLENTVDNRLRAHILGGLRNVFGKRATWDPLQAEIAGSLLRGGAAAGGWTGADPLGEIVDALHAHGTIADVAAFWRQHLREAGTTAGRVAPLYRLAGELEAGGETAAAADVLAKLLSEMPRGGVPAETVGRIRLRFALDLARIEAGSPEGRERAMARVDSIAAVPRDPDDPLRPRVLTAVAQWKEGVGRDASRPGPTAGADAPFAALLEEYTRRAR